MTLRVTAIGSLLSAFLSSLCCTGSLIVGVLGLSASATAFYAKALVSYRPVFVTLALLSLAVGFISVYRRKEDCMTDPACRGRPKKGLQVVLWVATIVTLILILLPDLLAVGI